MYDVFVVCVHVASYVTRWHVLCAICYVLGVMCYVLCIMCDVLPLVQVCGMQAVLGVLCCMLPGI